MYKYEKMLEYPINIKSKDLKMAKLLAAQFGGPDSELGASLRYLSQRFTMPDEKGKALLSDIGCEELGHVEMICTMCRQLLKGATLQEMKDAGLDGYYSEHGYGLFPLDAAGVPFSVAGMGGTGDPVADLAEDMAAEEKARVTYEHLINLTNDRDVKDVLEFLRQREIVHYARFKELYEEYKKNLK
jgi:spore coat protein JC